MNNSKQMIDLCYECSLLKSTAIIDRSEELSQRLPKVSITALGGFPIVMTNTGQLQWCNNKATIEWLHEFIKHALGLSAVLTYTNPKDKSLLQLGNLCLEKNHCWAYHWITLSLVFAKWSPAVELSFSRDSRFKMSWIVSKDKFSKVFMATAGIKQWLDFVSHYKDDSFDLETREAMEQAHLLLELILNNE